MPNVSNHEQVFETLAEYGIILQMILVVWWWMSLSIEIVITSIICKIWLPSMTIWPGPLITLFKWLDVLPQYLKKPCGREIHG